MSKRPARNGALLFRAIKFAGKGGISSEPIKRLSRRSIIFLPHLTPPLFKRYRGRTCIMTLSQESRGFLPPPNGPSRRAIIGPKLGKLAGHENRHWIWLRERTLDKDNWDGEEINRESLLLYLGFLSSQRMREYVTTLVPRSRVLPPHLTAKEKRRIDRTTN